VRFWGPYSRRLDLKTLFQGRALLVSTPQRLLNLLDRSVSQDNSFTRALCAKLSLAVVDEAHRAGAPTYIKLAGLIGKRNPKVAFVGLTATPFRTEYAAAEDGIAALKETFQELLEAGSLGKAPRETLQRMEVLSRLTIKEIKTHIDLQIPDKAEPPIGKLAPQKQEDVDQLLKSESDLPRRRLAILPTLLAIAREPNASILYFGPTVNDAQAMTFLLRTRGISSAFIGADTRTPTRRATVQDFKQGKLKVLCNCEVLTTGFDAPRVTHIVIARPTVSRVLWEQMIGRGMRGPKFGGTAHCIVYDCVDNFKGDPGKVKGFLEYKQAWYRELASDVK
jgi:DNA repair protein RadD